MIGLRLKLAGLAVLSVLATVGYLWARWRLAQRRADTATARAETLEATHRLEVDTELRRRTLRQRQAKLRAQIEAAQGRGYFE